jgi:hypothetical protein
MYCKSIITFTRGSIFSSLAFNLLFNQIVDPSEATAEAAQGMENARSEK